MKRAYSPKEIVRKTYKTLPWGGRWAETFGFPEDRAMWCISGSSASGKSSFVMQLAEELTHYGRVLYESFEEGLSRTFQERIKRFELDKRQGMFRVSVGDTVPELQERLARRNSPKFIIVDSFQEAGWEWPETKALIEAFPRKSFIFIIQEDKGRPIGKTAVRLVFKADVKVRVVGYKAYCLGRYTQDAASSFVVWEEGLMRTTNNIPK